MARIFGLLFLWTFQISFCSEVIVLKSDNFQQISSSEDNLLVEFYAPWCGHCQSLEPEYEKAAAALKERGIKVAKVDATIEDKLAEKYGVSGYPTLKLFKKGEFAKDYKGQRSSDAIVKFMTAVAEGNEPEDEEEDEGHGEDNNYGEEAEGEGGAADSPDKSEEVIGVMNLDSFTFDKIIGTNTFDVFMKIDTAYAYGDKEKQWAKLTQRIANLTGSRTSEFLLGAIGVEDYGDKLNDDLRERLGVKTEDFPVFKLFKRNSKEPITYTGDIDVDAMSSFLTQEVGIYIGLPGCIEAFDRLAKGFPEFSEADQRGRSAQATAQLAGVAEAERTAGQYYVRVMQRIAEKGAAFPQAEALRLEKLADSKITDEKKAEMQLRLNILASFGAKLTKKVKPAEAKDEGNGNDAE